MEDTLILEETEDTPKIIFDKVNNNFEMSGRSLPEDASKFFDPIHEWIKEYVKSPNTSTEFHLKLDYFNSASARKIVEILFILEDIISTDNEIKVIWFYNEEDEVMEARGEEVKSVVDLPFELQKY